jgi:hypothetical protein
MGNASQVDNPKRAHFRVEKLVVEVVLLLKGGLYDVFDVVHDGPVLALAELDSAIEIHPSNRQSATAAPETVPVSLKVSINGSALEQAVKRIAGVQHKGEAVHGFRVRSTPSPPETQALPSPPPPHTHAHFPTHPHPHHSSWCALRTHSMCPSESQQLMEETPVRLPETRRTLPVVNAACGWLA